MDPVKDFRRYSTVVRLSPTNQEHSSYDKIKESDAHKIQVPSFFVSLKSRWSVIASSERVLTIFYVYDDLYEIYIIRYTKILVVLTRFYIYDDFYVA